MSLGTGPERLVQLFEDTWQATRTGRGDVPPMYDPNTDMNLQTDVVVPLRNREESGVDRGIHDILHFYHPEGNPPDVTDNGYREVREVETVQLDIELTDRTVHSNAQGEQRLSARERMTGSRADVADTSEPPYPGVQGEAMYVLETVRRGLDEWDRVNMSPVNQYLGNSNANVSYNIELIQLARNTVQ
jgi:hypothetical protein